MQVSYQIINTNSVGLIRHYKIQMYVQEYIVLPRIVLACWYGVRRVLRSLCDTGLVLLLENGYYEGNIYILKCAEPFFVDTPEQNTIIPMGLTLSKGIRRDYFHTSIRVCVLSYLTGFCSITWTVSRTKVCKSHNSV